MDGTGPGLMAEGWQVSTKVTGGCHHLGVHEDDINWSLCPLAAQGTRPWLDQHFSEIGAMDIPQAWFPPQPGSTLHVLSSHVVLTEPLLATIKQHCPVLGPPAP